MWKEIRRNYRRLVASLLTMVMVATNVGGNLGTVFAAGETESALFLVEGKALRDAVREAVEQGETFSFSSLELAARKKSIRNKYEELLGKKKGKVYELDLDIDSSYAPEGTSLQVFYQEGTKDVIFLFLNESDLVVDYRVNIDGYETKPVTVNPNTANIDEEMEGLPGYAENYEAADMIDDVVEKPKAEVLTPQETESADGNPGEPEDSTLPAEGETEGEGSIQEPEESDAGNEAAKPGETEEAKPDEAEESEETETVKPEGSTEAETDELEELEEEPEEEIKEAESGIEVPEMTKSPKEENEEPEESKEAEGAPAGEELLGISGHKVALVAISAEDPEHEGIVIETEEEANPDEAEQEAEEETPKDNVKEEADEMSEAEPGEENGAEEGSEPETEKETESETEKEPEAETEDKVTEEDGSEAEEESEPEAETESETETEKESETGDIQAGDTATKAEETEASSAEEMKGETEPETEEEKTGKIEMDGQALEDEEIEHLGELEGTAFDTVTIKNHVNVKALKVSWEDIAKVIEEEYLVDYTVNPMGGAEIVGAEYVAGGEDLCFAVETEEEYEIVSVTANGEELEPAEADTLTLASDSNAGERDGWEKYSYVYVVGQVSSDLEIVVELDPDIELAVLRSPALESAIALLDALPEAEEIYHYQPEINVNEEEDPQGYTKAYWESVQEYLTELGGQVAEAREAYENLAEEEKEAISPEKTQKLEGLETILAEFVIPELSLLNLENMAAVIGEGETMRGYETLQAAVDDVKEGETISLLRDVSQSVVSENKTYTLNMNGMTIGALDDAGSTYTVRGGNVTLLNGVIRGVRKESGTFSIKGAGLHVENARLRAEGVRISWENGDGQKLVMDISKFSSSQQRGYSFMGGGIYAENCDLELDRCVITGNGGEVKGSIDIYGGGIYMKGGSLDMEGCEISGNYLELNTTSKSYHPYGGGIYAEGAELRLAESTISGNTSEHKSTDGYGTAIYLEGSTLTGEGLTISGNKSSNKVVETKNSDLNLKKIHISENGSKRAIHMQKGTLNLEEAEIDGGGLTLTEVSGRLYDTTIQKSGFAFLVQNKTTTEKLSLDKVRIRGNTAVYNDNIILVQTKGEFTAKDCIISDNEVVSKVEKHIISLSGEGEKTLDNCTISSNVCLYTGSSILARNSTIGVDVKTPFNIKGGRIENNRARCAGAILNKGTVKGNISDESGAEKATVIRGNTSDMAGAIFNTGSGSVELNHTVIKGNATTAKGTGSGIVGGVYTEGALFALNSGALYGNINEEAEKKFAGAYDLWIKSGKEGRVLPAAEMYDPEVTEAGYFTDYRWLETLTPYGKAEAGGLEGIEQGERKYKAVAYDEREIVAKVGNEGFATLKQALQKVSNGGTVDLVPQKYGGLDNAVLLDTSMTISKNITIRMNGASIKTTTPLGRLLQVSKGYKLTLEGEGDIFGQITVAKGAEMALDGNVRIHVQNENVQGSSNSNFPVINDGTVTVGSDAEIDKLLIRQNGTLKVEGKVKELGINYNVNVLETTIHSEVEKLMIHGFTESKPNHIIKVKDGFRADEILYSGMIVQQASQGDVTLIQGESSDYLASVKENISVAFTDKKNFGVIEADGNNIVLRKESTDGVYLAGNGNDANDGKTSSKKVKTFGRAKELLEEYGWNKIYVVGTVAIDNAQEWELKEGQRLMRYPTYTGALAQVNAKGTLTLRNITMDGAANVGVSAIAPLVVVKGGTCNIEDGAVLQNNTNTTNRLGSSTDLYGGAIYSEGTVQMNGGAIANNQAYVGGGVFVNSGTFTVSGGEIRGNKATGMDTTGHYHSAGGGILVARTGHVMMEGGTVSGNTAYHGGGVSLANDSNDFISAESYKPQFTMEGGTIRENTSGESGGGIFIQHRCVATINRGTIEENTSKGGAYGGGGIYVNGGKGGYENGLLLLKNVAIRENTSHSGSGKALASCPTSQVSIHVTDGAVIYDNKPVSSSGISDLYIKSGIINGVSGHPSVMVSPFMLGGGAYHWKDKSGSELPLNGIKLVYSGQLAAFTEVTANDITAHEDDFRVKIQNNEAWTQGGGIGSNGNVIIGSETGELVDIDIEKIWENVSYDYEKPEVDVEIWRGVEGQNPENQEKIGFIRLTEKDGWKASVKGLPKVSGSGETYVYDVREVENGYLSKIEAPVIQETQDGATTRTSYSWKVVNTPQYNLKLEKQVEREPGDLRDSTFHFTIQLGNIGDQTLQTVRTNRDGTTEEGQLTFVKGNGNRGTAEVDLAAGESILLKGIPGAMNYMISESLSGAQETYINGEAHSETGTAYGNLKLGTQSVVFQNIFGPVQKIAVAKQVTGNDGDRDKEFQFTLNLSMDEKKDEKQLQGEIRRTLAKADGSTEVTAETLTKIIDKDGKAYFQMKFPLKHGETMTIEVPKGTNWSVTEDEANQDGYRTEVKGAVSGNALAEDLIGDKTIVFTNEKVKGNLTISKQVTSEDGNIGALQDREFTFRIVLTDEEGEPLAKNPVYARGRENSLSPETEDLLPDESAENTYKVTLKHGQAVTILDLPRGTRYQVAEEEANQDGYVTLTKDAEGIIGSSTVEENGVIKAVTMEAAFENHLNKPGSLTIKKTVTGNGGETQRKFRFQVDFEKNGEEPKEGFTYTGTVGGMAASGVIHSGEPVYLQSGDYVTIKEIPGGTGYRVTEAEANQEGYVTTVKGVVTGEAAGTLMNQEAAIEEFVNHRELTKGSLAVQKIVTGTRGDRNRAFTFHILLTDEEGNVLAGSYPYTGSSIENGIDAPKNGNFILSEGTGMVALKHGQRITISGLPAGTHYRVTEAEANKEGYTTASSNGTGIIQAEGTIIAEFTNNRPGGGGGGNNGGGGNPGGGGSTPGGPGTTTTIDTPEVPLANFTEIDPDNILIEEEEVPLASWLPRTGDSRHLAALLLMFGSAGIGMLAAALGLKKREEDAK